MYFIVLLAAGVSCDKEIPGQAGHDGTVAGHDGTVVGDEDGLVCTATFRLNVHTKTTGIGNFPEDEISRVDIFEYTSSAYTEIGNHYSLTAEELQEGTFHLQNRYGATMGYLIVANMSDYVVTHLAATPFYCLRDQVFQWSDLYDGTCFPMTAGAYVSYNSDQTVDVDLKRIMCRIDVGEIKVEFDDETWMNKDVFVRRIGLVNVMNSWLISSANASAFLGMPRYLYGDMVSTTEDKPYFGNLLSGQAGRVLTYCSGSQTVSRPRDGSRQRIPNVLNNNYMAGAGTFSFDASDATLSATLQSYDKSLGEGRVCSSTDAGQSHTLTVNKRFYSIAGGTYQGSYGVLQFSNQQNSYPKLVVELEVDGQRYFYPIQIYYPQCNTVYKIDRITLKSAGSAYSNFYEKMAQMDMEINVQPWEEVDIANIDTGYIDEHHTGTYNNG